MGKIRVLLARFQPPLEKHFGIQTECLRHIHEPLLHTWKRIRELEQGLLFLWQEPGKRQNKESSTTNLL